MTYTYKYPRPSVTVDCVVFGVGPTPNDGQQLQVLVIERKDEPFKGAAALPGGFVEVRDHGGTEAEAAKGGMDPEDQGEGLEFAAHRELREETGIEVNYLEQLCTVGTPGRDPRGRVITVAYMALVRTVDHVAKAGSDAKHAGWVCVKGALKHPNNPSRPYFAFDHAKILATAYERLQSKIRYAPIGFNLLPPKFTVGELKELYETILDRKLDRGNFSRIVRRLNDHGILVKVGKQEGVPHKPGDIYRFDKRTYDKAVRDGFGFEL